MYYKRKSLKNAKYCCPTRPSIFYTRGRNTQRQKTYSVYSMFLLMVARKMITLNWMKVLSQNIFHWTQRLKTPVYTIQYMTAKLQMNMGMFLQRWTTVMLYLSL